MAKNHFMHCIYLHCSDVIVNKIYSMWICISFKEKQNQHYRMALEKVSSFSSSKPKLHERKAVIDKWLKKGCMDDYWFGLIEILLDKVIP